MGSEENIQALKNSQRLQIIEARRSVAAAERSRKSAAVWSSLSALTEFTDADIISCYISYGEEVETVDRVRTLIRHGRRLAVPVMGTDNGQPSFSELKSWEELSANAFGILEPLPEYVRILPPRSIPLFIIPGVAFDRRGQRLGYGLGFFDRALRGICPESLLVGLAFEVQIVDDVPVNDHDLPVDLIITEKHVIETSARTRSTEEVY